MLLYGSIWNAETELIFGSIPTRPKSSILLMVFGIASLLVVWWCALPAPRENRQGHSSLRSGPVPAQRVDPSDPLPGSGAGLVQEAA